MTLILSQREDLEGRVLVRLVQASKSAGLLTEAPNTSTRDILDMLREHVRELLVLLQELELESEPV